MDNYRPASAASSPLQQTARDPINNDAHLSKPLKRLSLHSMTASTSAPRPQSPSLPSPRLPIHPPRPSSVMSRRPESPALPALNGSRRSSFVPNMPSSPLAHPYEEERKPAPRACDIAEECFTRELERHQNMEGAANAGTIVLIHDQCYGHRFARPKTNKTTLGAIVERPERMLATVRGISTAYVRLGERHCEGANPLRPDQDIPDRIPFKIRKTTRMVGLDSQVVTNVHGTKWMEELNTLCQNAGEKLASTGKELARDPPAVPGQPPKPAFHPMDLYLSSESLNALQGSLGGVLDAVDAVFKTPSPDNTISRAFVCIRPPGHHCSAEWPSGFCWLNNVHIGIEHAMMNYGLTHAAIIDFDLHHGDGSQDITWDRNKRVQNMHKNTPNWKKTSIGYFSLHDINSFPCEDGDDEKVRAASLCIDNAHGQSIWNIHLETWSTVDEFWRLYEGKYLVLLEKARNYLKYHTNRLRRSPNHPTPKAAIFLSAGFDASEWEGAGMQRHTVNVPTEFYARFTRDVVRIAEDLETGAGGRVISVLEGGYSDRALASGVLSHLSGLCDGQVFTEPPVSKLSFNTPQFTNGTSTSDDAIIDDLASLKLSAEPGMVPLTYDPAWWHETRLAELENLAVPPPPAVMQKKVRTGPAAHFSSPTQSFTAKVVDPTKLTRTLSERERYPYSPSRIPTPPPPEVDWVTATHALTKLLIPSDRQTRSFRPEELAEPKVKKEKPAPAPVLTSVHVDSSGRQLRGRKPITSYADNGSDDESKRPASRANRRQTIADFPLASDEPEVKRTASRRMSIASSVGSVSENRSVSRASNAASGRRSVAPAPAPAATGIPVKKARAPSSTTASSRLPKTKAVPPVPRVPSNYMSKTAASSEKEKENDMDQLTSQVQRIKLNLPPKEEYEAKMKAKDGEKKPKTTRKPAAPRATKPAAKKPARTSKSSKPSSPVPTETPTPPFALEQPQTAVVEQVSLEQPKPIKAETQTFPLVEPVPAPELPKQDPPSSGRLSSSVLEPPTDLVEMSITPEQLPVPSCVQVHEHSPTTLTPPRPDTPPPPPPPMDMMQPQAPLPSLSPSNEASSFIMPVYQITPPTAPTAAPVPAPASAPMPAYATNFPAGPLSPPSQRDKLPVFSANGVIPFAPSPNANTAPAPLAPKPAPKDIWEVPETPAR